jgi:hypothetical protein
MRFALSLAMFAVASSLLLTPGDAVAADVDLSELKPFCDGPFKFDAASKSCLKDDTALKALDNVSKCSGPGLKWAPATGQETTGQCTAVSGEEPKPKCNPKVFGLKLKDDKCVFSTTTQQDEATDFFKDWAVGIAIIKPKVPTVQEASVVNDKVRVSHLIRQESALLVARHFYPWNPGRRCREGGYFATDAQERNTLGGGVSGFLANCVGLMVAAATPTSGAVNGQVINFLGAGLAIGGGITGTNQFNWHFGVGLGRKFNVRVLGEEWEDGKAPPPGESQIRYKHVDVEAEFVYFTFRW